MVRSLKFFFREFWANITRTPILSASFLTQFCVSLVMLGAFLVFSLWLGAMVKQGEAYFAVSVYISPTIEGDEDVRRVGEAITRIRGVQAVKYVSRSEALEIMKKRFQMDFNDLMGGNPFPSKFEVQVDPEAPAEEMAREIQKIDGVAEIDLPRRAEFLTRLRLLIWAGEWITVIVILSLLLSTLFTVINTMRLAAYARRREIQVMEMVGATDWFIRWPFILEGLIGGFFCAMLALASVTVMFGTLWRYTRQYFGFLPFPDFRIGMFLLGAALLSFALAVGAVGSFVAVNRFLKGVEE